MLLMAPFYSINTQALMSYSNVKCAVSLHQDNLWDLDRLMLCPRLWSGLGRVIVLLNSQFYRNSSFVVPLILNNLFWSAAPFWHLLTSSPGKHAQEHESLIRTRKGQVVLISLCKRPLYCRNQTSKVGIRSNIFRPVRDSLSDSALVAPFYELKRGHSNWNVAHLT